MSRDIDRVVGGRFRIEQRIGAGGMGVVYRALDTQTDRRVALKELAGRTGDDLERARRECRVLERLAHPAIVAHVADGVTEDGTLYLAMEWVDGVTVAERLRDTGLTLADAVAITHQVAVALAAAHGASIIHRDIKPSNVLLVGGDPRRVKLIDFGVARVVDGVQALTRTGAAIGTPGYMSPEQARGEREPTPAVDVFGLGCLLYECATARPAFSGMTAAAVLAKILLAEPRPIAEQCPEAPDWLRALISRMLAKSAGERIARCDEVAAALTGAEVPAGPSRSSVRRDPAIGWSLAQRLANIVSAAPPPTAPSTVDHVHCVILASRGGLEEIVEPPDAAQQAALAGAAGAFTARCEVCANGSLIAHVEGRYADTVRRAASCALALREVLGDAWSLAISAARPEPDTAIDDGALRLGQAAIEAIFRPHAGVIALDPTVADLLDDRFCVERAGGDAPRLVGRR